MTSTTKAKWVRVKRSNRCPVCGRPDWCLITEDRSACICPRTPSSHPINGRSGDFVGYLHRLNGDMPTPIFRPPPRRARRQDLKLLARQHETAVNPDRLESFARQMGLTVASLHRLGIGWTHDRRAWSFPMMDDSGAIIGIRLRTPDGAKFAVNGSRNGLFIPSGLPDDGLLLLAEGPTSTAALLDLGYAAVGRPGCNSGRGFVLDMLSRGRRRDVVVFGDHDEAKVRPDGSKFYPGQEGAAVLAQELLPACRSVKVIIPPFTKDPRSWKSAGATRALVDAVIRSANYVRPQRHNERGEI